MFLYYNWNLLLVRLYIQSKTPPVLNARTVTHGGKNWVSFVQILFIRILEQQKSQNMELIVCFLATPTDVGSLMRTGWKI